MNIEKQQEYLIQSTSAQNLLIFKEAIETSKLKNTWIAQIVTISGTLLGGLTMFSNNKNIVESIGLLILFGTIVLGLILMIRNLNYESNRLAYTFSGLNDYSLRALMLSFFSQKENLTQEEKKQKEILEDELKALNIEMGLVKEDGNLNSFAKSLQLDKVSIGNYILIFGLSIGGLLITLSNQIIEFINCLCTC